MSFTNDDFMSDLRRFFLEDLKSKAEALLLKKDIHAEMLKQAFETSASDARTNEFSHLANYIGEGLILSDPFVMAFFLKGLIIYIQELSSTLEDSEELFQLTRSNHLKRKKSLVLYSAYDLNFVIKGDEQGQIIDNPRYIKFPVENTFLQGHIIHQGQPIPVISWELIDEKYKKPVFPIKRFLMITCSHETFAWMIDPLSMRTVQLSPDELNQYSSGYKVDIVMDGKLVSIIHFKKMIEDLKNQDPQMPRLNIKVAS